MQNISIVLYLYLYCTVRGEKEKTFYLYFDSEV